VLLLNPAFLYAATWTFVLLLYSLRLSELLDPLRAPTVILVVGTSLTFIIGWALESLPNYGRLATAKLNLDTLGKAINSERVGKRLRLVWIAFVAGIAFETVFFGGIPLLGLIGIGAPISYKEFGIPGFHGLLHSFFYTGCAVTFARVLLGSSKRTGLLMAVSIGYPVLVISRQIMISLILQYLLIYFSIRRPSPRLMFRAVVLLGVVLLIFGYLGDARSGRDSIIQLAAPTFDYPDWLPSAFIWVYIYFATPLNNVNFNIDISPNYFPLETAGSFIPSFAREEFRSSLGGTTQWDLVSDSFNVGSLLQSLLTDFGVYGAAVFTLLCGIVFSWLRRRAISSPSAFFAVIVVLHGIALSFFANLLFHLVFVFQIVTTSWVLRRSGR
jgi:oligosaccharide repeat unit polymerase